MSRSKIRRALPLGLIHVRLRLSNLLTGQSELRALSSFGAAAPDGDGGI